MIELAFLRAYLAWEVFLEETFILYVLGMKAPRSAAPQRFTFPPSRREAKEWVRDGREHTSWTVGAIHKRAPRYFREGKPFNPALKSNQNALEQATTIRNAIAHESESARNKFKNLARDQLKGILPPTLSPRKFLNTLVPGSAPPQSFLEFYLGKIEFVADKIVPT